ncbi:MAG TPA: ABC transporter ATP-binding protein [Chloroflexota bacterium]|nr:ABC transporter ATP-binding protein [Chloroflexota bacterium]
MMSEPGQNGTPSWRAQLRAAAALLAVSYRAAPGRTVAVLLLEPGGAVLGALSALWLKLVADAVAQGAAQPALAGALALGASFGLGRLMVAGGIRLRMTLQERVAFSLEEQLARIVAAVPGLEPFERPEYLDRLDLLRQEREYFVFSLNALVQGLREVARLVSTVTLLAAVDPLLLLLPALGLPGLLAGIASRRLGERAEEAAVEDRRLAGHLLRCATSAAEGREQRIFGLGPELERRWGAATARADAAVNRAEGRGALLQTAAWLAFGLGFAGAVAVVVWRVLRDQAGAGDVLLVVTLAGGVAGNVRSVAIWAAELMGALRFLARYLVVTAYAGAAGAAARAGGARVPPPARLESGVTLERLSFRYPGTESWVMREVDLHLPAGATVALVGENGAGKSTLVKLLCRLYEPTEGRILVDGVDLAQLDLQAWRGRLSAGFQDFARLEVLARETVGVGDLPRAEDTPAVMAALERAAAADIVSHLERGLETQLGRTWDGTDLSGGQWQQLALGRAMMRARPLLLILDEPTASLDAETEYALFERYATAARSRVAEGAITVLVSHRFSTVRMADLIVVLDRGRVAEAGSHAALLARRGLYAELYGLQSRAYR